MGIIKDEEAHTPNSTFAKIKQPITSGQLQITRCNDNACERLYVTLKGNIKK